MKVLHGRVLKSGKRQILIELEKDEQMPVCPICDDKFYRLAYPMNDQVIAGHILKDPSPVTWCSFEQKWIST